MHNLTEKFIMKLQQSASRKLALETHARNVSPETEHTLHLFDCSNNYTAKGISFPKIVLKQDESRGTKMNLDSSLKPHRK